VKYDEIASVPRTRTAYLDDGLRRGTVYYYTVRAATDEDVSEPSVKVRTQPGIVEEAAVSVLDHTGIDISWRPPESSDITGYHLERANVQVWTEDQLKRLKSRIRPLPEPSVGAIRQIGPFKQITRNLLKEPSFHDAVDLTQPHATEGTPLLKSSLSDEHLDPNGRSYRFAVFAYRIRAVNALGVESGPSPYFLTIPSAPRRVFAREDGGTCRLKWARNPERNLKGYRVYRLDGRWDKDPISRLTPVPVSDLTFSDTSAGDSSRRYHVVAVDALGQEGLPSAPVWYEREWRRFYLPFVGEWHQ
jgi:hypothetical protein